MSLSASRHGLRCDSTTQRPVDESPRDARSACFALARPAGSMTAACSSPALEMRCHRHAAREQPSLARIWPVWCGPPRGERPRFMDDAARYDERVTTCGDVVAKYIVYPIACARGVLPLSSSTSLHGSVAVSSGCRGDPTRPRSAIREERERSRRVKSGYSIVLESLSAPCFHPIAKEAGWALLQLGRERWSPSTWEWAMRQRSGRRGAERRRGAPSARTVPASFTSSRIRFPRAPTV